jgi:hypothetical protein
VLVVMEDRDVHAALRLLLHVKTLGRLQQQQQQQQPGLEANTISAHPSRQLVSRSSGCAVALT